MNGEIVAQVVGSVLLLVGTFFTARYAARSSMVAAGKSERTENRRVDVEEWTAILGQLRTDLGALKSDLEKAHGRIAELERQDEDQRDVLQLHAAWDHMAVAELRAKGVTALSEPPPLYAPRSA